jgi:hypothetical protein
MLIENGKLNHFWSSDGAECLWCSQVRSAEEIAAWKAAGSPDTPCPGSQSAIARFAAQQQEGGF